MSFTKSLIFIFIILFSSTSLLSNGFPRDICRFEKIYQVGDFSESFIDLLAYSTSIPFVTPYKNNNFTDGDFSHGVNFAELDSTALPYEVLASQNITPPMNTTSSLQVQLERMNSYLEFLCLENKDCGVKLQDALFMVGEIGGNDYYYGMFQGNKSMDEVRNMVPQVVDAIIEAVKKVISFGATRIVVPGNFQIGCLPIYKTAFNNMNISAAASASAYDDNHCLKDFNELAMYHNEKLQQALDSLRQDQKPEAIIVYGDYYKAYQYLIERANMYGVETEKACCGIGGEFNFNMSRMCGSDPDVPVCSKPDEFVSWDGIRLTTLGYDVMSNWLLKNMIFKQLGLWCFYNN